MISRVTATLPVVCDRSAGARTTATDRGRSGPSSRLRPSARPSGSFRS